MKERDRERKKKRKGEIERERERERERETVPERETEKRVERERESKRASEKERERERERQSERESVAKLTMQWHWGRLNRINGKNNWGVDSQQLFSTTVRLHSQLFPVGSSFCILERRIRFGPRQMRKLNGIAQGASV